MFRTVPLSINRNFFSVHTAMVYVIQVCWQQDQDFPSCFCCQQISEISASRKVKVKWSRYRPGVAQRVGRGTALLFQDRGTRRGWVVSSTPRPHFTPGKEPVPIVQDAEWAPGPGWTGGKSRSHREWIPDRSACSSVVVPTELSGSQISAFFFLWRYDPTRATASSFTRFLDHTQRRITVGRTRLDEWSARRRDLYLTTHNTHNRQISMPPVGLEPTISAGERP